MPFFVSLKSALSDLRLNLYSALDVNILYGSATPFVTKSSIITPMYASDLSRMKGSSFFNDKAALIPAIKPCAAASS